MAKKTISKKEYLQVVGLMTLARKYTDMVQSCEKALGQLLEIEKEFGGYGLVSDAIWGMTDENIDVGGQFSIHKLSDEKPLFPHIFWELLDDNLEHQSEECINFIASLL